MPKSSRFSKQLSEQLFPLSGRVHTGEKMALSCPDASLLMLIEAADERGHGSTASVRALSPRSPHCSPAVGMPWLQVRFMQKP